MSDLDTKFEKLIEGEFDSKKLLEQFKKDLNKHKIIPETIKEELVAEVASDIEIISENEDLSLADKVSLLEDTQQQVLKYLENLVDPNVDSKNDLYKQNLHAGQHSAEPSAIVDMSLYDAKFAELSRQWESRISRVTSQIFLDLQNGPHHSGPHTGGGSGSVNIMDNDDVVHKRLELLANNDILAFNRDENKYVSNSINTVMGGGGNAVPLFVQNTTPTTIDSHKGNKNVKRI